MGGEYITGQEEEEFYKNCQKEEKPKTTEEELWYSICHLIECYRKLTGRSFLADYDEMLRGN